MLHIQYRKLRVDIVFVCGRELDVTRYEVMWNYARIRWKHLTGTGFSSKQILWCIYLTKSPHHLIVHIIILQVDCKRPHDLQLCSINNYKLNISGLCHYYSIPAPPHPHHPGQLRQRPGRTCACRSSWTPGSDAAGGAGFSCDASSKASLAYGRSLYPSSSLQKHTQFIISAMAPRSPSGVGVSVLRSAQYVPMPMWRPLRRASVFLRQRARECTVTGFLMMRPSFTSFLIAWPATHTQC